MRFFDRFKKNKQKPEQETSPGGSRIYKYEEKENESWRPPTVTPYMEEIEGYFDNIFPGRETKVFHEIISDMLHIDVYAMYPNEQEDFYVLYTSGMSALPMSLPKDLKKKYKFLERAELMIMLPKDWNLAGLGEGSDKISNEDYWPVYMLKSLARFPHEYETWLGHGHTIPNGPDYEPYASNTGLSCMMLAAFDGMSGFETKDGTNVNIYALIPLYEEETEFKLQKGADELLDKLAASSDTHFMLDIKRGNIVK